MAEFTWTLQSEHAAELMAEGELTTSKVAETVEVSRRTLYRWLDEPEFQARIEAILDDFRKAVRRRGLAILERRVEKLNDRWKRMHDVIDARAASPEMKGVPGGETGLIVRDLKGIGKGDDFQVVETYSVDTGLMRSILDVEKQAAQELGQWTDKSEVHGASGGPMVVKILKSVSMDDL